MPWAARTLVSYIVRSSRPMQRRTLKHISLLGSTGSIGKQTLDVAESHKDDLKVVALAAGSRHLDVLVKQIEQFAPEVVSVPTADDALQLSALLRQKPKNLSIEYGDQGLEIVASHPLAQTVVTGVVGFLGLKPTIAAIKKGKTIALANKETMVAAGSIVVPLLTKHKASIVPVDSEHSAIFQALADTRPMQDRREQIAQLILTGSGGPFRTWTAEQIKNATVDDALKHPNWSMGPKITIDSATLMNKGLEIIEARWLFDLSPTRIKVVIHPQSILHSAVEFIDGSIVGQLGVPDMRLPIHYAIFYPERVQSDRVPRLNLVDMAKLTFEEPDTNRFPCLRIAREIAGHDDTMPCVLNAANEIVVGMFLEKKIAFGEISTYIEQVLDKHNAVSKPDLDDILEADRWARLQARQLAGLVAP
jgi:1-deoxy-D-xylulose-5-phosphate reductoisomerase